MTQKFYTTVCTDPHRLNLRLFLGSLVSLVFLLPGCGKKKETQTSNSPFTISSTRTSTTVIASDFLLMSGGTYVPNGPDNGASESVWKRLQPTASVHNLLKNQPLNTPRAASTQPAATWVYYAAKCAWGTPDGNTNSPINAGYSVYFSSPSTPVGPFELNSGSLSTAFTPNSSLTCSLLQTPGTRNTTDQVTIVLNYVDSNLKFAPLTLQDESLSITWDYTTWYAFDANPGPPAIINTAYGSICSGSATSQAIRLAGRFTLSQNNTAQPVVDYSAFGNITATIGTDSLITTGTLTIYNNLAHLIANATVTNATYRQDCPYATSGTIATQFSASTIPNAPQPLPAFSAYVNATESLTFSSPCGTATYVDITGKSSTFNLSQNY